MVKRTLHFVSVLLLSSGLLGLTGCWFKRKPPVPQPQAQAPTTTEPQPAPAPQEPPPATEPQPEQKPADTAEAQPPKPKPKAKPKNHTAHKQAPAPKPEEKPQQEAVLKPPPKIIIQEGGADTSAGQISTTTPGQSQNLSTAKLLEATEANLRSLRRTLTADEQATVAQIKDYLEQSRAATKQQDLVRAHNLALKAHLLSEELVKK